MLRYKKQPTCFVCNKKVPCHYTLISPYFFGESPDSVDGCFCCVTCEKSFDTHKFWNDFVRDQFETLNIE